ncbi:MAG: hypothetical protein OCD02_00245 [Spirochaetaceae bacterium]
MKRIILTMLAVMSVGLFANSTSEDLTRSIRTTESRISYETVGEKQVYPSDSIISVFTGHADYPVSAEYLAAGIDLRNVSSDVLDDMDSVLDDYDYDDTDEDADEDDDVDVESLITDLLKSELVKGEIEYTYMIVGRNLFTASYDF